MFTRPLLETVDIKRQQEILRNVAALTDLGKITTTRTRSLGSINAQNLRKAHALLETGKVIGKITLAGFNI